MVLGYGINRYLNIIYRGLLSAPFDESMEISLMLDTDAAKEEMGRKSGK